MTAGQKTAESLKPARGHIALAPAFDPQATGKLTAVFPSDAWHGLVVVH